MKGSDNLHKAVSILVVSCDEYSDLWDDFFNLKERFWGDCPFETYLVNNSMDYSRHGVKVINCGDDAKWSDRMRMAISKVDTPYVCPILEDHFICKTVITETILSIVDMVISQNIDYINLGDPFHRKFSDKKYYSEHIIEIPTNRKWGVDTSAGFWKREFLLKLLGNGSYTAWQFEVDRCEDAKHPERYNNNIILYDERHPLNVTTIPVVVQGLVYPESIKYFRSIGYTINTNGREVMTKKQVLINHIKWMASSLKNEKIKKLLKVISSKVWGIKFYTN